MQTSWQWNKTAHTRSRSQWAADTPNQAATHTHFPRRTREDGNHQRVERGKQARKTVGKMAVSPAGSVRQLLST